MRRLLPLLLGFVFFTAWAQQSAPPSSADASPQATAHRDAPDTPLKTADGTAVCPADLKTRSLPDSVYRIGGNVLAPRPVRVPDPTFSKEGREYANEYRKEHHADFEAISMVHMIVDAKGAPRDICVIKEIGHGLDAKAVEAVQSWHFYPATRDGKPVATSLVAQVNFKLH